jgi:hypothetical protein
MSTRERVKALLSSGVSQVQAAQAIGVEESWVSQLMAEEEFRREVQEARAGLAIQHVEVDKRIDEIERRAWEKVGALLPLQTDAMKVLKVAQVANAARRKAEAAVVGNAQPATVVTLNLPQVTEVQFVLSTDRQVVEVAGRPLQTLSSSAVQALLGRKKAEQLVEDVTPQVSESTRRLLSEF